MQDSFADISLVTGHNLAQMTPFRPELVAALSVRAWSEIEVIFALSVVVMTFIQKGSDHSQSTGGPLGIFSFLVMVWKMTFAFLVTLDGAYVYLHAATEIPRPIVSLSMATLALTQARHILMQWATRQIVLGRPWGPSLVGGGDSHRGRHLFDNAVVAASAATFWMHRRR